MAGRSPYRSTVTVALVLWIALCTSETSLRDKSRHPNLSTRKRLDYPDIVGRPKPAKSGRGASATAATLDAISSEDAPEAAGLAGGKDALGEVQDLGTGSWRRRRRRYGKCSVPADSASTTYSNCNGAEARRRHGCTVRCNCGFSGGERHVTCHADGHGLSGAMPPCADIRRRRSLACKAHAPVPGATIESCKGKTSRRRQGCQGYCLPGFAPPDKAESDNPGNVSHAIECAPSTDNCADTSYAAGVFPDDQMPKCVEVRRRRSKICQYPSAPNTVFESCRQTTSRRRQTCQAFCVPGYAFPVESHKDNPLNASTEITCRPGSTAVLDTAHAAGTYDSSLFPPCTKVRRRRSKLCNMPPGMTDRNSEYTMSGVNGSLNFALCANATSRRRVTCKVTCSGGWRPPAIEATPEVAEMPTTVTCEPGSTDPLDTDHNAGELNVNQFPKCVAERRRRSRACLVPGIATAAGSLPAIPNLDFSSCGAVTSRRRTNCSVECAYGYNGPNAMVSCGEAHDKPGLMVAAEYPECPANRCSPTANLTGVNHTQCSNVTTGKVCRETCALGYSRDGKGALDFTTKLCNPDGTLSGPNVSCTANTCTNRLCPACPGCLPAGSCSVNYTQCTTTLTGQNCTATCSEGYTGNATQLKCAPALPWGPLRGFSPTCVANKCVPPVTPVGVNFSSCFNKTTTELCTARCADGYWQTGVWTDGNTSIRCAESGRFTGQIPLCEPKPCFPLVPNEPSFDGNYDLKNQTRNQFLQTRDPLNFSTPLQKYLFNDYWGAPVPRFSTEIQGAIGVNLTRCQDVRTAENCSVSCYPGFRARNQSLTFLSHNHSALMTCKGEGHMTGELPNCVGIPCHRLKNTNGIDFSQCANKTTTQQCTAVCASGPPGYGYLGKDAVLTCGANQKYLGKAPRCVKKEFLHHAIVASFKLGGVAPRQLGPMFDAHLRAAIKALEAFSDMNSSWIRVKHPPPATLVLGETQTIKNVLASELADGALRSESFELRLRLSNLNETYCKKGVGEMVGAFADGSFASNLGSLTGLKVNVSGLVATVVSNGPTDNRFDPFKKNSHAKLSSSTGINETDRTPGVTEINVQGTYNRATGQWETPELGEGQEIDEGSHDTLGSVARSMSTNSNHVEERHEVTQDLEYVYKDDWQRDTWDNGPISVEDDLTRLQW